MLAILNLYSYDPMCFLSGSGGIRGTVVAHWTADQQVERAILHQGHDSLQKSSHSPWLSLAQYRLNRAVWRTQFEYPNWYILISHRPIAHFISEAALNCESFLELFCRLMVLFSWQCCSLAYLCSFVFFVLRFLWFYLYLLSP